MRDKDVMMKDWGRDLQRLTQVAAILMTDICDLRERYG